MNTEEPISYEPIIKPLRLTMQCSIPVVSAEDAEITYDQIKIFLQTLDPKFTLNGQVIKLMEPCCEKQKRKER